MANFEIYDGDILVNTIIADSKEIAEQVTELAAVEVIPEEFAFEELEEIEDGA